MIEKRFNLKNKVAIITGASKGIGEAIAYALGQADAKLVINSRNQESIDQVVASFQSEGIEAVAIAANTGKESEIQMLVKKTMEVYGRIDIIVNNAGTNLLQAPIVDTSSKLFDKMMDINLKGPFWLCKYAYPYLKKQGGSIINISSVEGLQPSEGMGIYSMTKSALIMMTKTMAKEMGKDNIRVNAICPGYIRTKLTASLMDSEDTKAKIIGQQSIPHEAEPKDIAGTALLLASDAGQFFTGSVITVDGGFTL